MATIHNPSRFIPENYYPVDYIDNRGPDPMEYFGFGPAQGAAEALVAARKEFNAACAHYFGWRKGGDVANVPHNCDHCGAHIRYVVVAHHAPSDTYIAMGQICAERLGMTLEEHRLINLKEVAKKRKATIEQGGRYQGFLSLNPDYKDALERMHEHGISSDFLYDVSDRAFQYGTLSDRQISAFIKAVDRGIERKEQRKAESEHAAAAQSGRHDIAGEVVGLKSYDGYYGIVHKMLIKQPDGAKYFGTVPSAITVHKGDHVSLKATCTPSADDPSFATYKRPTGATVQRCEA